MQAEMLPRLPGQDAASAARSSGWRGHPLRPNPPSGSCGAGERERLARLPSAARHDAAGCRSEEGGGDAEGSVSPRPSWPPNRDEQPTTRAPRPYNPETSQHRRWAGSNAGRTGNARSLDRSSQAAQRQAERLVQQAGGAPMSTWPSPQRKPAVAPGPSSAVGAAAEQSPPPPWPRSSPAAELSAVGTGAGSPPLRPGLPGARTSNERSGGSLLPPPVRPDPPPAPPGGLGGPADGEASTSGRLQPRRSTPSLRALLGRQRMQEQRQRQQAGASAAQAQAQAQAASPSTRQQPAFLTYSQERQQQEQQFLVRQQHFRQQQLRVPVWARRMAQTLLLDMARLPDGGGGGAPVGAPGSALAELGLTEGMLRQLHGLLPPFQAQDAAAATRQGAHVPDAATQQQEQAGGGTTGASQPQAGDGDSPEAGQQQGPGGAAALNAGDVFAAELSSILSHYKQSAAAGSPAVTGAGPQAAPTLGAAEAGARQEAVPERQRTVDAGGFLLLLRALALLGEGMRSALAALLAAQRHSSGYPACTPDMLAPLLRLCNTLQEHRAALALVELAEEWGVALDRQMWQNVLDVCAKAGDPALVRHTMGRMAAAGVPPDEVSHTILVMAHEKAGQWREALAAAAAMRRAGLPRSSFTYRALVGALAGAGRLRAAAAMLDVMAADGVEGNAVVYQILINALLERGERQQVDRLLERMRGDGVRFSHQAVGRLTSFCLSRDQPELAFQLFRQIREMGLLSLEEPAGAGEAGGQSDDEREAAGEDAAAAIGPQTGAREQAASPPALTSLDPGSGSDEEDGGGGEAERAAAAQQAHQRARGQAANCYCRMIAACHRARLLEEAWQVYAWMVEDGLRPDRATYSRLCSMCAAAPARHAATAELLFERMAGEGVEADAYVYLHLVSALGAADQDGGAARWPAVLRVLHSMHMGMPSYRDTHVQTVAVSLAGRHGRLADALAVYRLMLRDGVQPRVPTFNALITACMRGGQPAKGFRFFEVMQAMGVQADVVTCSTLIACCERLGDAQRAMGVWEWMQQQGLRPDTVCHNTLIACLERCNQPAEALAVYDALLAQAEDNGGASFAALCDAVAKEGKWDRLRAAVKLKEWLEAQGEDPARATLPLLAARAAQHGGRWQQAVELFEGMEAELPSASPQPNATTFLSATIACSRLGDWRRALRVKDAMRARGLPPTLLVFNAALAACEAGGELDAAMGLLREMRSLGVPRDSYTYATLLGCCQAAAAGLQPALGLYRQMEEEGLTPTPFAVNSLLSACAAAGDADAAVRTYEHAVTALGMRLDEVALHCVMEAAGRAQRWALGLRFYVAWCRDLGGQSGAMALDLSQPSAAAQLDLHSLSVLGACIVLRGWLLHLKRCALQGQRLPPTERFLIVTGWGRHSANNVPRLRPMVVRMFGEELGAPLALQAHPTSPGAFHVAADTMYSWLLEGADLGFGSREEEEEAWGLMQELRLLQASQAAQPESPPAAVGEQAGRGGEPQPVPLPEQFQEYVRIAWAPGPGRKAAERRARDA